MDIFSSFELRRNHAVLQSALGRQDSDIDSLRRKLEVTERQLDKTMLALAALIEIIEGRGTLTQEEVATHMDAIDLRDVESRPLNTPDVTACCFNRATFYHSACCGTREWEGG